MKFGLFGGAKSKGEGAAGDSLGYRQYIDYVLAADRLGFHGVFVVEHHFTGVGQVSASLNLLTYLAARTEQIRLGTAVVVLPWHNPALLAEQAATLDLLSNGRLDFGVGKGYRAVRVRRLLHSDRGGDRALRRGDRRSCARRGPARGVSRTRAAAGLSTTSSSSRPDPTAASAVLDGRRQPESIRRAAREGYNLLLDQIAPVDVIIDRVRTYHAERKEAADEAGGDQVAVARALQIARTEAERQVALDVRMRTLKAIGGLARGPGAERYQNIGSHADPGSPGKIRRCWGRSTRSSRD